MDGLLPPEVLRTGSAVHTCQGHVKEVTGPDEPLAHAGRRAGGPGANAWHIAAIPPGGSGRHGVLASRFFRRQRHFRAPAVVSLPSCASARARGVRPGRRDTSVRLPPTHPHPPHTLASAGPLPPPRSRRGRTRRACPSRAATRFVTGSGAWSGSFESDVLRVLW